MTDTGHPEKVPTNPVVNSLMRALWVLVVRAGGTVTIPADECATAVGGSFQCSWDEERGITVSIADNHPGVMQ